MSSDKPRLTLVGRAWCHLCDDMRAALAPLREELPFDLQEIDLETRPDLEERYGERIPVLEADGRELCHYFLDAAAVRAHLAKFR